MKVNQSLFAPLFLISYAALLCGCGAGGDEGSESPDSPGGAEIFVMQNGGDSVGTVMRMSGDLDEESSFVLQANEGIAFDSQGNLYAAGDRSGPPSSLEMVANAVRRSREPGLLILPDNRADRQFTVSESNNFKGIHLAEALGLIFIANHNGNSIEVFSTSAGGNAEAIASFATPASPWDLVYDALGDRAFIALTNGDILVVDEFVGRDYTSDVTRTITPGSGVSNMHGIDYVAAEDTLVVSDVGDPDSAEDGKLFVISRASEVQGQITPDRAIFGASTQLGNPVDLQLLGDTVYIAEKSNDKILAYDNILSGDSGDIAADFSVDIIKPESLAIVPRRLPEVTDNSDIEAPELAAALAVSLNPAEPAGNPDIVQLTKGLDDRAGLPPEVFLSRKTLESIKYNSLGDAYVTFDENGAGGIFVINRAATQRALSEPNLQLFDRIIQGPQTGLVSPKGLDFVEEHGFIIVTENSPTDPSIKVFGAHADGNVAPIINTTMPVAPWDADYEPSDDTLYVTAVDGNVLIYDDYLALGNNAVLTRVIRPAIDGEIMPSPTNLHGIVYVEDEDMLLLSDVGSGQIGTDGKLYGIANASRADGTTDVAFYINNGDNNAAGNTLLGNPVDIAFDGQHLYVAEKSQNFVLRFDNILNTDSGDISPRLSLSVIAPESVALLPAELLNK